MARKFVTISPCGGGVIKDIPANELAPNQWSDALNMRFSNQIAQRRGGTRAAWTTPSVQPYAIQTFVTTAGTRFVIEAGLAKVYVDDGTTPVEITRYTDGAVISSITNVTTTATVTTATNHGRSNGDTITVFGATPAAYNGTFVITVTGVTTFTYTMLSDPGGSATAVGQYSYNVTSNFTGAIADRWSIFAFNGVLILSNPVDGPYYWNGDTTTRMRRLPGWASGEKAYAMRSFKNYLIAMAPTLAGTFKPHTVMWSNAAEAGAVPTTWTATSTNDAGDTPQAAESGGYLVDGLPLGDQFIVYKDDATFAMTYIGGTQVFSIVRLPGGDGLRARACVVEIPSGRHVYLSNGDVRIHAGGESQSIAEGKVRRWLATYIDGTYGNRSFVCVNPAFSEVWVVFPAINQELPNTVAAWNWKDDTWSLFEIPASTCAATGLIASGVDAVAWQDLDFSWEGWATRWYQYEFGPNEQRLILATTTSLALADSGNYDLGSAITWRLEKTGTTIGDNDSMKVISRSRPQIIATAGTEFTVTHTTTLQASDTPVYPATVTYTAGTSEWANRFSSAGRFLAVKYSGSDEPSVAIRSYDVEFSTQGRF